METILDRLMAEFHERDLPTVTKRDARLPWISGKISTVIGMRRSGKTWFTYQVMAQLLSQGYPKEALLYLNFEDERLLPLKTSDLQHIPDTFYRRYPTMKDRVCAFFFDEIQNVPGWEQFVRRLLDTERAHICVTGSSSRLLSREISTSLRGRSLSAEIFPFGFRESLRHAGIENRLRVTPGPRLRAQLQNHFQRYLLNGGFPEVQHYEPIDRIRTLQEYVHTVIYRDLVERYNIGKIEPIKHLIHYLLNSPAALFSVNKFYNHLKSIQIPCRKDSLYTYVGYLDDAFLIFPIQLHSRSEKARKVNPSKIYFVDTGLIQAHSRDTYPQWGHLLENFVFMELRRKGIDIEYYRTTKGKEVDFLVTDTINKKRWLIQVSFTVADEQTRDREVQALSEAMSELGLDRSTIITGNETEKIRLDHGLIEVVPAWQWALLPQHEYDGST